MIFVSIGVTIRLGILGVFKVDEIFSKSFDLSSKVLDNIYVFRLKNSENSSSVSCSFWSSTEIGLPILTFITRRF